MVKKILNICLSVFTIIFVLLSFCGCKKNKNSEKEQLKEKLNSELFYVENELVIIANSINNIDYANYKIATEHKENTSNQSSKSDKNQQNSKEKDEKEKQGDSKNSESSSQNENGGDVQKTFSMAPNDILNRSKEIDWINLQNKIETIYTALTVIGVDLKEAGVPEEEINNFIGEIDKLTISIKDKQKEEVITNIVNVYKYLPEFIKKYDESSEKHNILALKYNLLICYNDVSLNKWDNYENEVTNIKLSYSNIESRNEEFNGKDINLKKVKSIIEELKKCNETRNQDVFFIKYKNLIQEINIL